MRRSLKSDFMHGGIISLFVQLLNYVHYLFIVPFSELIF